VSEQLFDIEEFRSQPLPSEEEVMTSWQGDIEKPVVSVLCNTFNQKMYIEDAFRGFLIQKTDFVFEVIVHDDASTDGTSEIVREYAKLYPKIFKPVIQTKNQYSKGKRIVLLSAEYALGEYFAICEGDDFWIYEDKLQQQYDALLKHPEIKLCFTSAFGLRNDGTTQEIANYGNEEKIISLSKVIRGGGSFMPTVSLFFHRDVINNMPSWFKDAPVGDYYIQIIGSMSGSLYFPSKTALYRLMAIGSWSESRAAVSKEKVITEIYLHEKILDKIEMKDSDRRYALAQLLLNASITLLKNKFKKDSIDCVKRSWQLYPNASNIQRLLYRTRFCIGISLTILYLRDSSTSIFNRYK
jgi:glycosyltransferase involved in cell wall biosynthesis